MTHEKKNITTFTNNSQLFIEIEYIELLGVKNQSSLSLLLPLCFSICIAYSYHRSSSHSSSSNSSSSSSSSSSLSASRNSARASATTALIFFAVISLLG